MIQARVRWRLACALCGLLCLAAGPAAAALRGTVATAAGARIEHARVVAGERAALTDDRGRFELSDVSPPVELRVEHPRFETLAVEVGAEDELPLELVMQPKQALFESVAVSARGGGASFLPTGGSATVVELDDLARPGSSVGEILADVPGVSENGQGGMFQTYSIRGVSRQRVLTLVSGMRIVAERRAGVSASFVDPGLLGSLDVLRGPASTHYGSGALGGVVQLFPRRFEGWTLEAGYESHADENYQRVGWQAATWTGGIARRHAVSDDAADGTRLPFGFSQTSATALRRWGQSGRTYQLLLIASQGADIGKPNTDFPDRTTVYPEEQHVLVRFGVESDRGWSADVWAHPNRLETRVDEPGTVTELENEAIDFGASGEMHWTRSARLTLRVGADSFGRRGVDAVETGTGMPALRTLDDAVEDEVGIHGTVEWKPERLVLVGGGRVAWQRQRNSGQASEDDSGVTGFAGLVVPLRSGLELAANVGTGLRFASLGERFFSGATGAGGVIGNRELDAERSFSADVGLRWFGRHLFLAAYVFRNDIDDYIERVETATPDVLTFVNLTSGTIDGVELEGLYRTGERFRLAFGGSTIEGRSNVNEPLADVPADRLFVGPRLVVGRWTAEGRWEHRAARGDFGSREKPIGDADLVSVAVTRRWPGGLRLALTGSNLLHEVYFNSADQRTAAAAGRSFGVSVSWQPATR